MSTALQPDLREADYTDEAGLFFRRLGEISFAQQNGGTLNSAPTPGLTRVAVAPRYGVVIFSDSGAVYVAQSTDILGHLRKWDNSDEPVPPTAPSSVCRCTLPLQRASHLSLTSDASLLAIATGKVVFVYSLSELLRVGASAPPPLRTDRFSVDVAQLAWQPQSASYSVVDSEGNVHVVDVAKGAIKRLTRAPANVRCLAWSSDGAAIAVGHINDTNTSSGVSHVSFCEAQEGSARCTVLLQSVEVHDASFQALVIEGLAWLSDNALLAVCRLLEDGHPSDLASCCVLNWEGSVLPTSATLLCCTELFPTNVIANADGKLDVGSRVTAATVPAWENAAVFAHLCSADDHIKVVLPTGNKSKHEPTGVDITDDKLAIRIPNAPQDEDNFVLGLGIDLTAAPGSNGVPHPTDETAPDLPPQPILWVATSDNVLRAYNFGTVSETAATATNSPLPVPKPPLVAKVAAPIAPAAVEAKAAATALPDDDFGSSDEDEHDKEEEEDEEEQEKHALTARQPFAQQPSVSSSRQEETQPAPLFGFGGATAFPFSQAGIAGLQPAFQSSTSPSQPAFAFAPPVTAPFGPSATTAGIQPAQHKAAAESPLSMANQLQLNQAAAMASKLKTTTTSGAESKLFADAAPHAMVKKTPTAVAIPAVSTTHTVVPAPAARLAKASSEAAALERDFLRSLHRTRELEAELHDALSDALKGAAGVEGSQPRFEHVRQQINEMQGRVGAQAEALGQLRKRFAELAASIKHGYARMEALVAFHPEGKTGIGDELKRRQPLDPTLSVLKETAEAHIKAIAPRLEEVSQCLDGLEERWLRHGSLEQGQNGHRAKAEQTSRVTAFYDAANAQTAIIAAQAQRLEALGAQAKALGLDLGITEDACLNSEPGSWLERMPPPGKNAGPTRLGFVASRTPSPRQLHGTSSKTTSPLLHIDASRPVRLPWRPVRGSPNVRKAFSPALHAPEKSPASVRKGLHVPSSRDVDTLDVWQGARGEALARDVLRRARGVEGGVRIVQVGGPVGKGAAISPLPSKRQGKPKSPLPPLPPLKIAELPEPYMPAAPAAQDDVKAFLSEPPGQLAKLAAAAKVPIVKAKTTPQQRPPSSSQPPLPSAAQIQAASKLSTAVLGSVSTATAPKSGKPASVKEPPLPSAAQLAASQALMAKAGGAPAPSPAKAAAVSTTASTAPPSPPIPSAAAFKAAQARMDAFNAVAAPSKPAVADSKPAETTATKSAFDFGGTVAAGTFGEKASSSSRGAPGTSTTITQGLVPSSATPAASSPFGATSTLGTSSAPSSSAASFAVSSASSPFGFGPWGSSSPSPTGAAAATPASSSAAETIGLGALAFGASSSGSGTASGAFSSPFGERKSSSSTFSTAAAAPTSGVFGGVAASSAADSVFGASKGGTFGASSSNPTGNSSPFGALSSSAAPSAGTPSAPAFGASTTPSSGFGQPSSFGMSATPMGGPFGQPSAFGKPAASAFGQPAAPASPFGQPATPGAFGQPAAFGQASAFGRSSVGVHSGGFAAFAASQGQAGGFGAVGQASGAGFGGFGGGGGFAASTPTKPPSGAKDMWQPRK